MIRTVELSALDHHFAGFINSIDQNPCDELWLAAALTSAVAIHGHVCLDLAETTGLEVLPFKPASDKFRVPEKDSWTRILTNCSSVGKPGDYMPLVLDKVGRLYLNRSWRNEQRVAEEIIARLTPLPLQHEPLKTGLDRYFPAADNDLDWQRVAAAAALTRRFTVISGGPGTGKTATVARILALLIELSDEKPHIVLATPTGKAAMRLRQSILGATEKMSLKEEVRNYLPDKVQTIHRLLGVIPKTTKFRHNRENRLKCDCLVVDEVSMVDLPLMARLLEALPDKARVILLGDRDQLASVEAGAVMADICNHGIESPFSSGFAELIENCCGPLPTSKTHSGKKANQEQISGYATISDSIINLKKSYRFGAESGIGILSRLINGGNGPAALEVLQSGKYPDLVWHPLPAAGSFEAAFLVAARAGFHNYSHSITPDTALDALEGFRVLSPHREGRFGVENLNRLTEKALGLQRDEDHGWCKMLPLMMTANNYDLGLYNGDTAVVMDDPGRGKLMAYFSDAEAGLRRISPLRLPPHQSAFAMTVHKSQGSEFEKVLLILPEHRSEVLSRQLLYTAVTRARGRVEIWGTEEVFLDAVEHSIKRNSGLRDRLWQESEQQDDE